MLPEKPWKTDALLRLIGSVVICSAFIGGLVEAVLEFFGQPDRTHAIPFLASASGALLLFVCALFVLGKPWKFEKLLHHIAVLVGCVYGGFFLMWLAMDFHKGDTEPAATTSRIVVAILSFQCAALIFVHRFLRESGTGWTKAFGLDHRLGQALLLGAFVAMVIFPISRELQRLSAMMMQSVHVQPKEQETVQVLRESVSWASQIVLGLTAVILAPVTEEVLFRGILYPSIKQAGFPRLALWLTSLLFGAIHANAATFLPLTVLALVLVWLYERSQNLLASIAAHSLFNTVNFVAVYVIKSIGPTPLQK